MTTFVLTRRGDALVPVDEEDREVVSRLREGEPLRVDIKARRNVRQHRLYWALVRLLQKNTDLWGSEEAASDSLKLAAGHVDQVMNPLTGEIQLKPRSIAFEKMEQAQFNRFFNRVLYIVSERLLGVANDELRGQVFDLVDGPERASLGRRAA